MAGKISMSEKLGLYIHIPFCERKCRYCGFLSFPGFGEELYERYTAALCKEISGYNEKFSSIYTPDTIFIGGGTPSLLDGEKIKRIMDSIRDSFFSGQGAADDGKGADDIEVTIESNPNSLTYEKLAAYRQAGINRLSMGAQSMNDRILDSLGRVHQSSDVGRAFEQARKAGFENINIDLMFGVPEQTLKDVLESVSSIIEMKPEHISLYGLQLEEDTIFYEEYKSGILDVPDEKEESRMYHAAADLLRQGGYDHYEISNWALSGYECRHNLKYWSMKDYLGAGPGAHSYIKGSRSKNVDRLDDYLDLIESGRSATDQRSYVFDSKEDAMGIFVFTALRTRQGVDTRAFEERFGESFFRVYKDRAELIKKYIDEGLMFLSGSRLALTEQGIDVSNDIMSEFV